VRTENGQIKDLVDGAVNTDGATIEQSTAIMHNGTKKILCKMVAFSAVVSGGSATFYLTDNGLAGGNAVFPNAVFKETANFWIDNATTQFQFGNFTVSPDRKTLTVTVNQIGSVLLGLLQFVGAANGVTVHLRIEGN